MNKIKFYFWCGLSHILYFLGDLVSKTFNWDWLNKDREFQAWVAGYIYNVYHWLMLKSSNIDDNGQYGLWTREDFNK